jgi:pyruvate formate lyase activating enzyme
VCGSCIRDAPESALELAAEVHRVSRRAFGLPEDPPRDRDGAACSLCARECVIGEERRGFCGLRASHDGRLTHLAGTSKRGLLKWYRDSLPTNCVADWVCSGHGRFGQHNLAVFYESCTLNCLFCQNWSFREASPGRSVGMTAEQLAAAANEDTYCVCFFGGDPASQMPHALSAARRLADRDVVVCWETAGTSNPRVLDHALRLSNDTGGCIKFDLKAHSEPLHIALTGASNRRTLENFSRAVRRVRERPEPPLVVASTLLVPGYVDADEVAAIATFIADHDPDIPYALLGFAPQFYMTDLPFTSLREAEEAESAARSAGLTNVRIGNHHLLW